MKYFPKVNGSWWMKKANKRYLLPHERSNSRAICGLHPIYMTPLFFYYENTGKLPSNRYFAVEPGNYSFQLAHPKYKFIPAEKIIKIAHNEYRTLIFSGQKESAAGKVIITSCEGSQICIDGHLTPFLCDDTLSAVTGDHYLSALDQHNTQKNLSSWFGFSADSTFLIHWDKDYRKWEKVNGEI